MKIWGKQIRALRLVLACILCLNLIPLQIFAASGEIEQTTPCYLLLIHTLEYHDTQYGFSEVVARCFR